MIKWCVLIAGVALSLPGNSQTLQQQVEKHVKDPQRKANAGKADVIIGSRKNIFDSTTFTRKATEGRNDKTGKFRGSKKKCGTKTNRDSKTSGTGKKA